MLLILYYIDFSIMKPNELYIIQENTPKSVQFPSISSQTPTNLPISLQSPKKEQINVNSSNISHPKNQYLQYTNTNFHLNSSSSNTHTNMNMSRMVPRCISRDKQDLYQQNIKLKQQINYLNSELVRFKTRANVSERQMNKIMQINSDGLIHRKFSNKSRTKNSVQRIIIQAKSNSKLRTNSKHSSNKNPASNSKIPWIYLYKNNNIKSIFRQTKQQNKQLKNDNDKLKKSLKYTQNSQLSIQNQHLISQCERLSNIIQQKCLEIQKTNKQFQNKLKTFTQENQKIKGINLFLTGQLKEKIAQIDGLRLQITKLNDNLKKQGQQSRQYQNQKIREKQKDQKHVDIHHPIDKQKQIQKQINQKQTQKQNQVTKQISNPHRLNKNSKTNINKQKSLKNPKQHHKQATKIRTELNHQQDHQSKNKALFKKQKESEPQLSTKKQIKQVLKYRFIYHRYTYDDLVTDIQKTNLQHLSVEQLIGMLTHQPFYLKNQQTQLVLNHIFSKKQDHNQLKRQDKIILRLPELEAKNQQVVKVKQFNMKIKYFIDDFVIISQSREEQILKKWKKIFKDNYKQLKQKYTRKHSTESSTSHTLPNINSVNKQEFRNILLSLFVKQQEMQLLLSEASIVSSTLDSINLQLFFSKLMK